MGRRDEVNKAGQNERQIESTKQFWERAKENIAEWNRLYDDVALAVEELNFWPGSGNEQEFLQMGQTFVVIRNGIKFSVYRCSDYRGTWYWGIFYKGNWGKIDPDRTTNSEEVFDILLEQARSPLNPLQIKSEPFRAVLRKIVDGFFHSGDSNFP